MQNNEENMYCSSLNRQRGENCEDKGAPPPYLPDQRARAVSCHHAAFVPRPVVRLAVVGSSPELSPLPTGLATFPVILPAATSQHLAPDCLINDVLLLRVMLPGPACNGRRCKAADRTDVWPVGLWSLGRHYLLSGITLLRLRTVRKPICFPNLRA